MAFKVGGGSTVSLETPERVFRDFAGRSYDGLLTFKDTSSGNIKSLLQHMIDSSTIRGIRK